MWILFVFFYESLVWILGFGIMGFFAKKKITEYTTCAFILGNIFLALWFYIVNIIFH